MRRKVKKVKDLFVGRASVEKGPTKTLNLNLSLDSLLFSPCLFPQLPPKILLRRKFSVLEGTPGESIDFPISTHSPASSFLSYLLLNRKNGNITIIIVEAGNAFSIF